MGQCVSRKGTHALARSSSSRSPPTLRRGTSTRSTTAVMIHKNRNKDSSIHSIYASLRHNFNRENNDESKGATRRGGPTPSTRGTAMSFGFRRRPVSATQVVLQDNTKPPDIDSNGNGRDFTHDLSDLSLNTSNISSRLSKRDTRTSAPPRFGFKQTSPAPKLTNKVSDVESKNNNFEKYRVKSPQTSDQNQNRRGTIGKYKLSSSSLPKPQMPVRLADKNAKQVANQSKRHDEQSSSKEGSLTEGDSGVSSHTSSDHYDSVHSIRQLDYSPTATYRKHRNRRQLEMVVKGKTFDLRDLNDDGTVIESSFIPLPKLPSVFQNEPQTRFTQDQFTLNKLMSTSTTSEESTEEKLRQDRARTEKRLALMTSSREQSEDSPVSSEECAGEAMIESISLSSIDEPDRTISAPKNHPLITKPNTRDVLLTIEDTKFAAVAASVTGHLLEDETSPVDSLISSCTDSEEIAVAKKEKSNKMTESNTSKDINEKAGIQSPGTPTNASLSLSDGKDFFDDEIADQPSLLVFDSEMGGSENTMVEDHPSLRKSIREQQQSLDAASLEPYNSPMLQRQVQKVTSSQQLARANSLDTLSPCDSIASDDLMMDFEQSMSSGFDDSTDKLDSKHGSGFNSLDSHVENRDFHRDVRQEWSALLNKRQRKDVSPSLSSATSRNGSRPVPRYRSTEPTDSPRSLDGSRSRIASTSSASHSPLRLSRRYQPTATSSPTPQLSAYDSDDSIRMERSTHGAILQDIVGVKTMLLKLKRVLQESETLNPFDSPLKNGNFKNNDAAAASSLQQLLLDSQIVGSEDRFELADLRRQVLFLQAQLEERERTVQQLRQQVVETASNSAPTSICESSAEMCNAATQTERIRPMSAGPSLLQGFPMNGEAKGPLVSLNNESPLIIKKHLKSKAPSLVEYRPATMDSTPPINLLRVFNHKKPETPLRNSRPVSPAHPSGIPTRRSLSHSRIRITNTQYL